MIVGEVKPIPEILAKVEGASSVLVAGCGGCVTVCHTGGLKEAETVARLLQLALSQQGVAVRWTSVSRQCEYELLEQLQVEAEGMDTVVSLACGIGVQAAAEVLPRCRVMPGLNTTFLGMPEAPGDFRERCQACGDCILDLTAGICPVARCSKSLLNGPCGGSQGGRCEISPDVPCAWQLIYDRLAERGMLDTMARLVPPKDWSRSRDGGPRRMKREDLMLDGEE
ncbi:MAG: methylenetetrahydrofolate reductase C-terminal domain-containing protein [Syntrophomonadaceae bacterium]|nr:methylenetetrahydrofolate reductase C-terminal domain-containing protein [Syntrophomonadaceae bacterium]